VFVELRGSDVQKILGLLFTAKVASLILSDSLSSKIRRYLEISDLRVQ
jgi:hypothetical protein